MSGGSIWNRVGGALDHSCGSTASTASALYLNPDYWGVGLGGELMTAAVDALRTEGWREARLWVLKDNVRAQRFYTRQGWLADGLSQPLPMPGSPREVRTQHPFMATAPPAGQPLAPSMDGGRTGRPPPGRPTRPRPTPRRSSRAPGVGLSVAAVVADRLGLGGRRPARLSLTPLTKLRRWIDTAPRSKR